MTNAGADWEVVSDSGTKHSFTDAASAGMPAALAYNKQNQQAFVESDCQFLRRNFRVATKRRKTCRTRWPNSTRK
jgi:hypothetical protein